MGAAGCGSLSFIHSFIRCADHRRRPMARCSATLRSTAVAGRSVGRERAARARKRRGQHGVPGFSLPVWAVRAGQKKKKKMVGLCAQSSSWRGRTGREGVLLKRTAKPHRPNCGELTDATPAMGAESSFSSIKRLQLSTIHTVVDHTEEYRLCLVVLELTQWTAKLTARCVLPSTAVSPNSYVPEADTRRSLRTAVSFLSVVRRRCIWLARSPERVHLHSVPCCKSGNTVQFDAQAFPACHSSSLPLSCGVIKECNRVRA